MFSKISLFTFLIFIGLNSVFGQEPQVESKGYLIGAGDKIVVKVMGEEQFSFEARIDEDGVIQVPFVDKTVSAQCRTEKDLRADITKLLTKYLKNPQVNLQVTERRSIVPVIVYGEVMQPQQVELRRKARLLELLSIAGGPKSDSAGGMVQVFHTQKPMCSTETWEGDKVANLSEVPSRMYSLTSIKQGNEEANPFIYPGDMIVVQKALPIYMVGEVKVPQGLYIPEGGLSLTRAVAMVSGVNPQAKTKDVRIYRLKANSTDRDIISVNLDFIKKGTQKDVMLEPYDIVEVDKAKDSIAKTILGLAIGTAKGFAGGFGNVLPQRVLY
jgi:protein involved in polysaccharide export with SLBB domain